MAGPDSNSGLKVERSALERILLGAVRLLVRIFFREVEVIGADQLPLARGGVLVAWHPNSLIDPSLLVAKFPGKVIFGAKHVLFDWPVLGPVMRAFGAVPIYRPKDSESLTDAERKAANDKSISAAASGIADGNFTALFPEGMSHNDPFLAPLRPGAARLFVQARSLQQSDAEPPVIIPVGLHYEEKQLFRSAALVWFHPPVEIPPDLVQGAGESLEPELVRERVGKLTTLIESALSDAVHPAEDWETHRLIHRTRKLVRAERAKRAGVVSLRPTLEEKVLGFARVQRAYYERLASHPEQTADLRDRVREYDENLAALELDDHELDMDPPLRGWSLLMLTLLQFVFVFLLLPPLLIVGYLVNLPVALLVQMSTRFLAKGPTEIASAKIMAGALFFPLAWLLVIPLGALAHVWIAESFPALPDTPFLTGVVLSLASIIGGAHVLRYQRVARQAWKNLRVRFRRRRQSKVIEETRALRAGVFDEIMEIAEGLDLPGVVSPGGAITQ